MYYTLEEKIYIEATPEEIYKYVSGSDADFKNFTGYGIIPAITGIRQISGDWHTPGSVTEISTADGGNVEEIVVATEPYSRHAFRIEKYFMPFKIVVKSAEGEYRYEPSNNGAVATWFYKYKLTTPLALPLAWLILGVFFRKAMKIKLGNLKKAMEK